MTSSAPLPGLRPYTESDAELFFGRQRDVDVIATNLRSQPLTVLYGPRGAGKTSVVRAGVVPLLRHLEPATRAAIVVLDCAIPGASLGEALGSELDRPLSKEQDPRLLIGDWSQDTGGHVFVILDHVEMLFSREPVSEVPILKQVVDLVNENGLHANVLVSILESSLFQLDALRPRLPLPFENLLRLDYLSRNEADTVIGRTYEIRGVPIDPARLQEIREAAKSPSGGGANSAGLWDPAALQIVLRETERTAPLHFSLREFVDRILYALSPAEQPLAASVIPLLVASANTRKSVSREELAQVSSKRESDVFLLLDRLTSLGLLKTVERATFTEYLLSYEHLGPSVMRWSIEYLDRERVDQEHLARRVRRYFMTLLMATASLLALGIFSFSLAQRYRATLQRVNQEEQVATYAQRKAEQVAKDAQSRLLIEIAKNEALERALAAGVVGAAARASNQTPDAAWCYQERKSNGKYGAYCHLSDANCETVKSGSKAATPCTQVSGLRGIKGWEPRRKGLRNSWYQENMLHQLPVPFPQLN